MSEAELLSVSECLKLKTLDNVRTQIDLRRNLIRTMVGNLYPSILFNELDQLYTHIARLSYDRT